MKLATAAEMKELDRQAIEERHIPSIDLMDRAAEGVAQAVLRLLPGRPGKHCRVSVFCGTGNNGGDGIAAARLLFLAGVRVRTFLVGDYEKLTTDALAETRRLSECGVELETYDPENLDQSAWARGSQALVDAIFGVGLSRDIQAESRFGRAIRLINECPGAVVAADIASGVEADTGRVLGCAAKADKTIAFTYKKIGQAVGDGALLSGDVTVWDIGIPKDLYMTSRAQTVESDFARDALPPRKPDGHKGNFGKLLVIGGAVGYTGAPYLTASAAVRSGCGLVYLGVPESIWAVEAGKCVSAMPFPLPEKNGLLSDKALQQILDKLDACDVLALGPGLGRSDRVTRLVCELLRQTEKPVVLDADGINLISGHKHLLRGRTTILTPHDGEFARLGFCPGHDRQAAAEAAANDLGCILLLKGHRTVITDGSRTYINTTGNPGMAVGGSGDLLAGMIVSLLGQHLAPLEAAACAAYLHGAAGDKCAEAMGQYGMLPTDMLEVLPRLMK